MSIPESSLPENWVERIFATMRATYGAAFDRQWECPASVSPAEHAQQLKQFWARELRHLQQNPDAIRYGLENLPEFPPNLPQFKALCNRRPDTKPLALPQPPVNEEFVRSVVADLAEKKQRAKRINWAEALKNREESGENLTEAQRKAWREALERINPAPVAEKFNPIPADVLPPEMRA